MPYKDPHNPKLMAYQRVYQRKYRQSQKYADYIKKYVRDNAERRLAVSKAWTKKNPDKVKAMCKRATAKKRRERGNLVRSREKVYKEVRRALVSGRLVKGFCEVCQNKNAIAHHDDYSKPLEVRWLCEKHHKEYHKKAGDYLNKLSSPVIN